MHSTGNDSRKADSVWHSPPPLPESGSGYSLRRNQARNTPAILCDFDDTTAVENVAELLLDEFSVGGPWRDLRRQSQEQTITFKEYQERAFATVKVTREAMKSAVKAKATLRPYFKELWSYCQAKHIPLAIVTVGLDFYVEALLEREGLEDVPRYAVKTNFTPGGITYEYPCPWDGSGGSELEVCRRSGNCKCSVVGNYRRRGHSIVYVGDGRTDFCPASIADHVFARSLLARLCNESMVPYTEFQDFRVVIDMLEREFPGPFDCPRAESQRGNLRSPNSGAQG